MNSDKLGVIAFFGILVPGAYLAGILAMSFASIVELGGLAGHVRVVGFISHNTAMSAGVFLFVAYFLGVLVRLFAPRYVDKLSEWYLVYVRRNKKEFPKDQFPYKKTLTVRLTEDGMEKIPQLMSRLNAAYGNMGNAPFFTVSGNVGNVSFFNYCKWFIDANDLALSRQVQEAEALVRFLSGTTLVLLIALVPSILFPIAFTLRGASLNSAFYCGLLTTDVICLVMILERFKYQRRREVMMVWSCVYLIVNGGTPRDLAHDRDRLCESVFFPARSENN